MWSLKYFRAFVKIIRVFAEVPKGSFEVLCFLQGFFFASLSDVRVGYYLPLLFCVMLELNYSAFS